jgi:PBP1b-binding outer membrane lipoprotein LpoB
MKKTIFSAMVMALLLVSCNQKVKETTPSDTHMMDDNNHMNNDNTNMMDTDSTMINNNSNMMTDKIYACPMHPEVQGKLNDKCYKCGMKLTEPVPEKTAESK